MGENAGAPTFFLFLSFFVCIFSGLLCVFFFQERKTGLASEYFGS